MIHKKLPLDGFLLLTLGLSIFAVAPLFYPGYFQTHSGFLPLWDIAALKTNPLNPAWFPAFTAFDPWRSDGLWPYHLAAVLPLSPLAALKLLAGAGLLGGSAGLYLWLKSWLGPHGATVAALAYTYAPFTLATLYVRGAWVETLFWGFLPWALLAATFLVANPRPPFILIAIGFWAGLGLLNWGLGFWAYLILVFMQLGFHRPQARAPLASALGGLLIAGGWRALRGSHPGAAIFPASLADHLLYPAQLISPFWGFGSSRPGWADGMSFSLGLAALGLTLLTITLWRNGADKRPWFFITVTGAVVLLVLPPLGRLWNLPGLSNTLGYPWQLLGFAALMLAVLSGVAFWLKAELQQWPVFGAIIGLVLLAMYPHLEPRFITPPIPAQPEAVFAENQLFLLSHAFVVPNPAPAADLAPEEPYLPLATAGALKPGDTLILQVAWQAVTPPVANYKIFAHLVDSAGKIITQVDVEPLNGEHPTTGWEAGEIIADQYTFTLPDGSSAPAQVWLGLYQPDTLQRLPVSGDSEGRVIINVR